MKTIYSYGSNDGEYDIRPLPGMFEQIADSIVNTPPEGVVVTVDAISVSAPDSEEVHQFLQENDLVVRIDFVPKSV